jgi:hypothetical protein
MVDLALALSAQATSPVNIKAQEAKILTIPRREFRRRDEALEVSLLDENLELSME